MNAHPVTAWLAARGIAPEEIVSVCWKPDPADFKALAVTAEKAASAIPAHLADADCWVSTNPLRPGLKPGRKGCEVDVVRWACVPADLDVKRGGMPTFEAAQNVIETLSGMLAVQPCAVVMTGHGLQPVWTLEPDPGVTDWSSSADPAFQEACALSRRWGALVRHVAALHGGAADSIVNLDRVLRAPGTVNRKSESEPVATTLELPGGGPLSLDRLRQALDAHTPTTAAAPRPVATRSTAGAQAPVQAGRYAAYERSIIQGELARLTELPRPWHEGARWDLTTFEVACNLLEVANSDWSALTIDEAEMLLHENAPQDHAWGERQVDAKWKSALNKVGDTPRPTPPERERDGDPFSLDYSAPVTRSGDAMAALPAGRAPTQTVMPTPAQPMEVARRLVADLWTRNGTPTLLRYQGMFYLWAGTHWAAAELDDLRSRVYIALEGTFYLKPTKEGFERVPWQPNKSSVANIVECLAAVSKPDFEIFEGMWLGQRPSGPAIALANGVVDVATRQVSAHSPLYFNLWSLPYEYCPDAAPPVRWLAFIEEVLGDEPGAIECLQEWFGYVLSGRTDLQKMLLILGPTRSGKGTISRVLLALVGARNVAAPSLSSMSSHFGLAPLIGKPLAVIADARVAMRSTRTAVEALLKIVGEDAQTIDRKNISTWTGTLGSRLMILANEPPSFLDASGAVAARFVVISMAKSFPRGQGGPRARGEARHRAARHPQLVTRRPRPADQAEAVHAAGRIGRRRRGHAPRRLVGRRVHRRPLRGRPAV